jgi:aminopeptidase N
MEVQVPAIKERQLKNICLALIATLDTPDIHAAIRSQIETGSVATDRLRAFSLYLHSTAPDRLAVMESAADEAAGHPVSWEAYLAAVGGCSAPDAVALIRRAGESPAFRMNQVNDHRALYGSFAANRKVSLQTPEGRELFGEILLELTPVNQNSVVALLRAFGAIDLMEEAYHLPLVELLIGVRDHTDPGQFGVVHHTIRRLLIGAPRAVRAYEAVHGPLTGIS